jgi:hypothetical protein
MRVDIQKGAALQALKSGFEIPLYKRAAFV